MNNSMDVFQSLESVVRNVYAGDKLDLMIYRVKALRTNALGIDDDAVQIRTLLSEVRSDIQAEINFSALRIGESLATNTFGTAAEGESILEHLTNSKLDLAELASFCRRLYQASLAEAFDNKAVRDKVHAGALTVRGSGISFASLRALHDEIISSVSSRVSAVLAQFDRSLCGFCDDLNNNAPTLITLTCPNVSKEFTLTDHFENVALEPLGLDQARLIGLTSILAGNIVSAAAFANPLITGVAMLLGATFSYKASKSGLARMSSKEFQRVVNINLDWYKESVSARMARTVDLFVSDAGAAIDTATRRVERRLSCLKEADAVLQQRTAKIRSECEETWASALQQIDDISGTVLSREHV